MKKHGITLYTEKGVNPELPETENGWKKCDITGLWFDSIDAFSMEEAHKLLVEAGYVFDRVDADGWHTYFVDGDQEDGLMANITILEDEE